MSEDRTPRQRPKTMTRRQKRPYGRKFRWPWLLPFLPVVLGVMLTIVLLNSPLLTVQQVEVEGTHSLSQDAIVEASGIQGASMFRLPREEATERLLAIPSVRDVSFARSWPNSLTITVEERQPAVLWSLNGRDYLVDAEGIVLGEAPAPGELPRVLDVTPDLTLDTGDRVQPDAVAFARRIVAESPGMLAENVMTMEYSAGIGVTVTFQDGLRVTFGDERSYDYKMAVLSQLLDQLDAQGVHPQAVDLRFGERVTYE